MPRSHRLDVANGVHHVTQRAFDRRNIVIDDDDRSHWWRLFVRVARRCRWGVFAVALLDSHFQIYRRTPEPNLSDLMRDLDGVVERPTGRSFNPGIVSSKRIGN